MQNYTAIWLDEELGLVLLSLTVGKQRDLACLCSCPWVKSSELHHTSYTAVSGITTSGWHCVCTHAHMCAWSGECLCAYVHLCVCTCEPSYVYIHSCLGWNARPQMDSVVIITKLYLQPQIWNTCNSFRAVWPDTKTKEIIVFLSNPINDW